MWNHSLWAPDPARTGYIWIVYGTVYRIRDDQGPGGEGGQGLHGLQRHQDGRAGQEQNWTGNITLRLSFKSPGSFLANFFTSGRICILHADLEPAFENHCLQDCLSHRKRLYWYRIVLFKGNKTWGEFITPRFLCTAVHVIISFSTFFLFLCCLFLFFGIPKVGWDAMK